jgi:hypothetical protein
MSTGSLPPVSSAAATASFFLSASVGPATSRARAHCARALFSAPGTRVGDGMSPPTSFGAHLVMSSVGGKSFFKSASDKPSRTSAYGASRCGTAGGVAAALLLAEGSRSEPSFDRIAFLRPVSADRDHRAPPTGPCQGQRDLGGAGRSPVIGTLSLMASTMSRSSSSMACSGLPRSALQSSLHLACAAASRTSFGLGRVTFGLGATLGRPSALDASGAPAATRLEAPPRRCEPV